MIDGRVQVQPAQRRPWVQSGSVQKFAADPGVGPEFEPVLISHWNWIHRKKSPWISFFPGEGLGTLELDTEWREKRVSGVQRWRRVSKLQTSGKISTYQSRGSEDVLPTTPPVHLQIAKEYRDHTNK